jgi:hypothetical protein
MMPSHSNISPQIIPNKAIAFGWLIVVFFLSTATLAQDSTETIPLPLASSVMFEQYDHGSLYKTHFEAPYNQHPCQPRKIHLSPSTDVDVGSGLYNATVSFTLDLSSVATTAVESDNRDLVRTRVTYGRGDATEGSVVIHYEKDDYSANNRNRITEEYTLLRFNYTSPTTGEYYKSDLIHHVLLKNLEAGRQRYWYNIRVEFLEGLSPAQTSRAVKPFFPPLMPPVETWYALQHPIMKFFLRGSYSKNKKREKEREQSQSQRKEKEAMLVVLGETPSYEFTTPPLYGNPTSIALVGDLGQTKNSSRTMARILGAARAGSYETTRGSTNNGDGYTADRSVTNLFIAGDLSYADGDPERWESWLDLAEPLLREVPFVSVPGNHEIECDKTTHDVFVPYESFFRNPNRIGDAIEVPPSQDYIDTMWNHLCTAPSEFLGRYDYGNAYFSYKQGLVHTIFLNSYTSLLEGSKQRDWLMKTALPEVDRNLTPWLIVIFHTPLYTTFSGHYGEINPTLMKASGLRNVFERYKVNLVVSGHDHAYLRTKALDDSGEVAKESKAPIFWTLGAGGNREGHSKYRNPDQAEDFVAKRDNDEFGFGLFFAPNKTHAHLQWMRDDDNHYNDDDDGDYNTSSASAPGNSSLVVRDNVWIENYYFDDPIDVEYIDFDWV